MRKPACELGGGLEGATPWNRHRPHRLRKFTGQFSEDGTPHFTLGYVSAETLWRFKGNQAPAVIVTDFELDDSKGPHGQRLSDGALTRATVAYEMLAFQDSQC